MQVEPTSKAMHIHPKRSTPRWLNGLLTLITVTWYTAVIWHVFASLPSRDTYDAVRSFLIFLFCTYVFYVSLKKPTPTGIVLDPEGIKQTSGMTLVKWHDVDDVMLVTQRIGTKHLLVLKLTDAGKRRIIAEAQPSERWGYKMHFLLYGNELIYRPNAFNIQTDDFATLIKDYHSRYGTTELLDESHL